MTETQRKTLADRRHMAANEIVKIVAIHGTNLGRETMTARTSIKKFHDISLIANKELQKQDEYADEVVAQREYNAAHARGLARYTLGGLVRSVIKEYAGRRVPPVVIDIRNELASGPYAALQPLVVNIRHLTASELYIDESRDTPEVIIFSLPATRKFFVVDGQHRRGGFELVLDFLDFVDRNGAYPRGKNPLFSPSWAGRDGKLTPEELEFWQKVRNVALNECSVSYEIHIGLSPEEEGQLFSDLNNRVKPPSKTLVQNLDHSDAIAAISRETEVIPFHIATDSDAKSWTSTGLPLSDIILINRLLVHGSNYRDATPYSVVEKKRPFIVRFWKVVSSIKGILDEQQRSHTVAGQPVVLKALAKLAHDLGYGVAAVKDEEGLEKLYDAITAGNLSFSHKEPMWQALFKNDADRAATFGDSTINDYVYLSAKTSAGLFDGNYVRFSSVHNDIYPRLGDLIRWKLGLKNRGAAAKARAKDEAAADAAAAAAQAA